MAADVDTRCAEALCMRDSIGVEERMLNPNLFRRIIDAPRAELIQAYIQIRHRDALRPAQPPTSIRIDASTVCQLRCEGCGFQKAGHRGLGGGFLTADKFRELLDSNPQIRRVELSNYGEIFLNPELIDIMRCAFEKGVALEAAMGVNFNTVSDEQLQALVDYRFSFISISIDGASQAAYAQYRIGGDFNRVIANIRRLQEIKELKGKKYPELQWQYVINEHNELEVGKAKEMARELNIPIVFKLNFMPSYQPTNREYLSRETGLDCLTRAEWLDKHHEPYLSEDCLQMFDDPQFNWDGKLLGCCRVEHDAYGTNLFEDGLVGSLQSPRFVLAKELLLQRNPSPRKYKDLPCWSCPLRKGRAKYHKRLTPKGR